MNPFTTSRLRWALLIVVLIVVVLWQSGLLAELSVGNLKAQQNGLACWTGANAWSVAVASHGLGAE